MGLRFPAPPSKLSRDEGEVAIFQLTIFVLLVATAGIVSLYARRVSVTLAFAVFFAIDGAYQAIRFPSGAHAALSAFAAIGFCGIAWAVDRISPEG